MRNKVNKYPRETYHFFNGDTGKQKKSTILKKKLDMHNALRHKGTITRCVIVQAGFKREFPGYKPNIKCVHWLTINKQQ